MAAIYDLYMSQGDDFAQSMDVSGDYTGYSIAGSVKDSTNTTTALTVAFTDEALGEFTISLTDTQTSALSNGVGHYDIEVTSAGGDTSKLLKGRVYVDGEVTV